MPRTLLILLIFTLHFVTCNLQSFAQQPPQYTQYIFNNYLINPAVGGSNDYIDVKLGYRTQWVGFGAAPKTYFLSIHSPLRGTGGREPRKFGTGNHHAIGGYAIKDQTGPIDRMGAYLSYSYHVRLGYKLRASLGFFAGALQYRLNSSGLRTAEPDPDITSISAITPDASVGGWLYSDKYFVGLSIQQLVPLNLGGTKNRLNQHYFITGGYRIKIKGYGSLIPSAHVKLGLLTPVAFDVNIRYNWMNRFWAGVSYRKVEGVLGLVGMNVELSKRLIMEIGYAYDFTLSKLRNYSANTHEIIVGLRIGQGEIEYRCPIW